MLVICPYVSMSSFNVGNAIRILSMDEINAAKSGHPGIALGAAPILYAAYSKVLKVTPKAI